MSSGFVAGTLVHTDKGLIPIQHLQVGDLVITTNENNFQENNLSKIKSIYKSENSSIFLILYADNYAEADTYENCILYPLLATKNNQLWVNYIGDFNFDVDEEEVQGWQKIDDILHGYEIELMGNEIGGIMGIYHFYEAPLENVFYSLGYDGLPNYLVEIQSSQIHYYFIEHLFNENLNPTEKLKYVRPKEFPEFSIEMETGYLTNNLIQKFYEFYINRLDDKLASRECFEIDLADNQSYFVGKKGLLVKNSTIQGKTE